MEIRYLPSTSYGEILDIDNQGEFALEACNDDGYFYYMVVKTFQGTVSIFTWGPIIPDMELIPEARGKEGAYTFKLTRLKWNEKKIKNTVTAWITNRDRGITQAKLISEQEALIQIKDMQKYIMQFGEDHN